jgi:hypothetical protein
MKASLKLLTLAGALCAGLLVANAAPKITPGPKGGKLLENTAPRAEFFVEKDRKVTITFYDEKLKPVPAGEQTATVIAQAKQGKQTLEFEKKDGALVSKTALPEGDGYLVVVQLQAKPDTKSQNFRIQYDTHTCGGCKLAEYACTCGH